VNVHSGLQESLTHDNFATSAIHMLGSSERPDICEAAKAIDTPEVLPQCGHERCGCILSKKDYSYSDPQQPV